MPERDDPATAVRTILAFDFGLRRIGVAVGQTVTNSASPLGVVDNTPAGPDHTRIVALLEEWRPDRLVVGMPYSAAGSPTDIRDAIREFVAELERYELPVAVVDESHTSLEAETVLKSARRAGRRGRLKKSDIDAAAAVLIAERFLADIRK